MFSPAIAEAILELAAEAGQIAEAGQHRLGLDGPDPAPVSTDQMADALSVFHFPDDVWARAIYDLVIVARDNPEQTEALVAALVPVYFGRVASFIVENRRLTTEQAEERVERQAREFELLKPHLVERWRERRP